MFRICSIHTNACNGSNCKRMITLIPFAIFLASGAWGSNILVMLPLPTFSHTNSFMPIFTELARRGHNVTMVSPFPQKKAIPNFHEVILKNTLEEVMSKMNFSKNRARPRNSFAQVLALWPFCKIFLDSTFNMPEFKKFLNDKQLKFDLVILEVFFCQQPFLAFAKKYNAPVVTMVSMSLTPTISLLSGNPNPVAYSPHLWSSFTDHMTFFERLQNSLMTVLEIAMEHLYGRRIMESYIENQITHYPGFENLPTLSQMLSNISLFLLDNHFSLNYQRPYLSNIVEFGGVSIKSGGILPENLSNFMNESKNGVIFFSWGSHYKMTNMKPELLSAFMSIFSKLKQRVLMKWEEETLPGKPDNVKIAPWFPQASILGHPNIRLFISHGGIHGLSEATYNGVPVLGTPIFGDQAKNVQFLKIAGMALNVDIQTVTEDSLFATLKKLLDDPKYKENAMKRSLIFKDRPLSALDNAVYWVEYVLRHKGAGHLKAGSLDLTWYQNMLLDIAALFLLVLGASLSLLFYTTKLLCKSCKGTPRTCEKDKKD